MLPLLQIGPFSLRTPGLALIVGLWLALEFASRAGVRRNIDGDRIYTVGFGALVAGLAGARLGFILLNLNLYTGISPWTRALLAGVALIPGAELAWVGVLAAIGAAVLLARRARLPLLPLADVLAQGIAVFVIGIATANLFSGDYFGMETGLPWAIYLWGARRHPTQILLGLAGGAVLVLLRRAEAKNPALPPGRLAQMGLILLSLAILLIEPLRADSPVVEDGVRLWEVIALIGLVGGLASLAYAAPPVLRKDQAANDTSAL